ncbi:MAG: DUF4351 domain-containing protein [Cyanobacteria bacterium]|nr:DUF4351 domain-containing protein [Cyanobacteria bacterium GSL.Bin1]
MLLGSILNKLPRLSREEIAEALLDFATVADLESWLQQSNV